jgi:DeoR/GlpR family transcriptional regulator of sugar metabolism
MVEFLPEDLPLRVITPSLLVARRVATHRNHQLVQLGGVFDPVSVSFGGLLTELTASRLKIDRFFFSCTGIDATHGATEPSEDRARTKQRIIELSTWNCALADHSKIGTKADYVFAAPAEIDLLVTDRPLPPDTAAALHTAGIAIRSDETAPAPATEHPLQ